MGWFRSRLGSPAIGVFLLLTWILSGPFVQAAELNARHRLQIELFPDEQKLQAIDDITIEKSPADFLTFELSSRADQIEVAINGKPAEIEFKNGRLNLHLTAKDKVREIKISMRYSAIFDDPVPVRPVNTENPGFGVSATISKRGSFLLAGSGWYPELVGGRSTYSLKVMAPEGMIAVTAGQSKGHTTKNKKTESAWVINDPIRGLSLSVGPYRVREKKVGKITAATYFLPQTDHLADAYLAATAKYLSLYQDLFGPYPFGKFAVVENFFPTGYGFPSYTLMGGSVLRLPFIIHTSLGHEIAHCWWGNGVQVDYEAGNWSEALTTYTADYLYREMKSEEDAQNYRRQILRNYATLVKPSDDFALKQFQSRSDPVTKTIGYDKGAMVFHMLRKMLGEEAFWGALRDLYRNQLFKATSWADIQKAFEIRGKRSLEGFFGQWVFGKGAPQFYLDAVKSRWTGAVWKIEGRIVQKSPDFRFDLKLGLENRENTVFKTIRVTDKETPFQIVSKSMPQRLIADPDRDILRRLFPSEIPPAINAIKSSPAVLALLSDDLAPEVKQAAKTLILSLGLKNYTLSEESTVNPQQLLNKDILMIGYPQKKEIFRKLPDQIAINQNSFRLNAASYQQSSDVFFGVFPHPFAENRVVALFLPLSGRYAEDVARKITHYGKYSYLAFQNGKNKDKGFWSTEQSPLEYRWNPGAN
jgi:hypothetical protein